MQRLKELLEVAVAHSTFDLGHTEMRHGDVVTSFTSSPEEVISPQRFRELLLEIKWNAEGVNRPRRAKLICPDELLSQLEGHLRLLLGEYVDPDTNLIGYALPSVVTGGSGWTTYANRVNSVSSASPLDVFAQGLVRASVVLGIEALMSLVSGWLEGEPVKYRTSALVNGLYISAPVTPIDGVHIKPLPLSSDELPASLPTLGRLSATDYLGRTVVSIDCAATPALFHPPPIRQSPHIQVASVPNIGINEVCQALSLECDIHVDIGFFWEDYLGLEDAFPFSGSSIYSTGGAPPKEGPSDWMVIEQESCYRDRHSHSSRRLDGNSPGGTDSTHAQGSHESQVHVDPEYSLSVDEVKGHPSGLRRPIH